MDSQGGRHTSRKTGGGSRRRDHSSGENESSSSSGGGSGGRSREGSGRSKSSSDAAQTTGTVSASGGEKGGPPSEGSGKKTPVGGKKSADAKGGDTASSSSSSRSSDASGEERGEMISKDKQELAQRMLEVVEAVLAHINTCHLVGPDAVQYILENSVDVQRIATLQQLHQHVDPANEALMEKALTGIFSCISDCTPKVQMAAVDGIKRILGDLSGELRERIVEWVIPMIDESRRDGSESTASQQTREPSSPGATSTAPPPPARPVPVMDDSTSIGSIVESKKAWVKLYHDTITLLPPQFVIQVFREHIEHLLAPDAQVKDKHFGLKTLQVVLERLPEAGSVALPHFIRLAQDPSTEVRSAIVKDLPVLFKCVSPIALREQLLITVLTLLVDADLQVSSATFLAMIELPLYVGDAFTRSVLRPVLKQYVTAAPPPVLLVVMQSYGKLLWHLKDTLDPLPSEVVTKLVGRQSSGKRSGSGNEASGRSPSSRLAANAGLARSTGAGGARTESPKASAAASSSATFALGSSLSQGGISYAASRMNDALEAASDSDWLFFVNEYVRQCQSSEADIRAACAFNAPGVVASVPEQLRADLFACIKTLMKDSVVKVRVTIAAGMHELCAFSKDPVSQILPIVAALSGDTSVEVKEKFFRNLTVVLSTVKTALSSTTKRDSFFSTLTPLIIGYEKEIHTNWRKVAVLLKHMQYFPEWFSPADLFTKFVPLLVSHLVNGASALNRQVCRTICLFLRRFDTLEDCVKVLVAVRNMTSVLSRNKSAAGRIGFIVLFVEMLQTFSQEFVRAMMFTALAPLAVDKVINVRCVLARFAPQLRHYPAIASQVEKAIYTPLSDDADADVKRALQDAEGKLSNSSSLDGFSATRNEALRKEEGTMLLGSEAMKKATETIEAANQKASEKQNAVAAAVRKKGK